MHSCSNSCNLAAFSLGYSINTLKDRIDSNSDNIIAAKIFDEYENQLKIYKECYYELFEEDIDFPIEYISKSEITDFFTTLFEITEERISKHYNKNLIVYYYAGGLIYLSDSTNVVFERNKFKIIFYQILCELGCNISWNELESVTSKLFCSEYTLRKAGKNQLLEFVFPSDGKYKYDL